MKDLNLSLLIRYGYSGLLLFGMLLLRYPQEIKSYVEGAGDILAPLVVFAIGACIYVIYRHLLGEWIIYPLAHCIDWLTSKKNRSPNALSPFWHLKNLGLPWQQRRDAYNAIRREFIPENLQKQLNAAHAEIHVLYITALELPILGILRPDFTFWPYFVALFALMAAWAADIRQHRSELKSILATRPTVDLKDFLRSRGYTVI